MEARNVLADHMDIGGPKFLKLRRALVRIADAGDVVGQRVHPDIDDMARRVRHRNAPIQRGARNRQILQPAFDEADDFVAALRRQDEIRIVLVMAQQLVLIVREPEEIGLLLGPFDRRALRADAHAVLAQLGLVLGVEGFVAHRIPAGIGVQIDVAIVLHPAPDFGDGVMMARLGRADEIVIGDVQRLVHGAEALRVALAQLGRADALPCGGLLHLQPVLVDAGQEKHIIAVQPLETRDGVRRDRLIGVADMRIAIRIGNGGGNIEGRFFRHDFGIRC